MNTPGKTKIVIDVHARDMTRGLFDKLSKGVEQLEAKSIKAARAIDGLGGSLAGYAERTLGSFDRIDVDAVNVEPADEQGALGGLAMEMRAEQLERLAELEVEYQQLVEQTNQAVELQAEAIRYFGVVLEEVGDTFVEGFADLVFEGSWNAEQAIKGLTRSIITGLMKALIRYAAQMIVMRMIQSIQVAMLALEAKEVAKLERHYWRLAMAKEAASRNYAGVAAAMAGYTSSFISKHAGGYIGGYQRAHGGLSIDEIGPFVLQPGEFVLNRDAVRSLGVQGVAYMNETGSYPQGQGGLVIENIVVNASSGDGPQIAREFLEELRWEMDTGGFTVPQRAIQRT